ncbi:MAG: hypothetical protein J6W00_06515 [Lentisphaeria bacterium]|nr:hypothetical protein [Lentisphaeria bacterium]
MVKINNEYLFADRYQYRLGHFVVLSLFLQKTAVEDDYFCRSSIISLALLLDSDFYSNSKTRRIFPASDRYVSFDVFSCFYLEFNRCDIGIEQIAER